MGYYSQNPHYLPEDYSGDIARLERAEAEAGSWFDYATKPQAARYAEQMAVAGAYRGAPKWDRIREAAQKEFAETTKEAAALCDQTVQHYIAHGEILEALADRWETLAAKTNAAAFGAPHGEDYFDHVAALRIHHGLKQDGTPITQAAE